MSAKKSKAPTNQRKQFMATRDVVSGQVVVMPTGDFDTHNEFVKEFLISLKPVGPVEKQLAQTIAESAWQMNRYRGFVDQILSQKAMHRVDKYNQDQNPQLNEAFAVASVVAQITRDLANLSVCESRSFRTFERAHDRLLEIQEARKAQEYAEMVEAKKFMALHEEEELQKQEAQEEAAGKTGADAAAMPPYVPVPYDPKKDGFVFSITDIKAKIHREERLQRARNCSLTTTAAA
jgi:hypothetical protein